MGVDMRSSIGRSPTARPEIEAYIVPDGTCFLYDPTRDEGFALDQLGALVWDYCDGATSREQIAAEVSALLPNHSDLAERVNELLAMFATQGLLLPDAAMLSSDATGQPQKGAP
jgi:hypothetical protein